MPNTFCHKNVVFIGAGNVATHLSQAMKGAGFSIRQIFSRTADSAKPLADICGCGFTMDVKKILPDADLYIFSLKDDALPEIIAGLSTNNIPAKNGLWVHTAGSVHIDVFKGFTKHYGVIYPLQTLSKSRETDFSKIPLFVEGNTESIENEIFNITSTLSENVTRMTSEKRKHLHLAAVFASNFSNHMYAIAAQILEKQGVDYKILQPLIDETANKLHSMSPKQAQTGPAVRYDVNIIERHLSMLEDENIRKLYKIISENIAKAKLFSGQLSVDSKKTDN